MRCGNCADLQHLSDVSMCAIEYIVDIVRNGSSRRDPILWAASLHQHVKRLVLNNGEWSEAFGYPADNLRAVSQN